MSVRGVEEFEYGTPIYQSTTSSVNSNTKGIKNGRSKQHYDPVKRNIREEKPVSNLDLFESRAVIPHVVYCRRVSSVTSDVVPRRRFRRVPPDEVY
jgi:hypothetical protein